jgi:hypothetical protein
MERPSAASSGGSTITLTTAAPKVVKFFLVPEPAPKKGVGWAAGVADNKPGARSSKKCCVFHKKRAFDESSDEGSSSSSSDGGGDDDGAGGGGGGGGGGGPAPAADPPPPAADPPPPAGARAGFRPDGAQPTASVRERLKRRGAAPLAEGGECPHCKAIEELRVRGRAAGGAEAAGGGGGGGGDSAAPP